MNTDRPLIVISLDGLATSALGCYGSSWNATPAIDAIAGGGCVWDRCIAASDDPIAVLGNTFRNGGASLWRDSWSGKGSLDLITDSTSLISRLGETCFDRIDGITAEEPTTSVTAVTDVVDSQLGRLIAAAIERDAQEDPWSVLWIHSDFLRRRWDAPRDLFPIDELAEPDMGEEEVPGLSSEDLDDQPEAIDPIFADLIPPRLQLESNHHPDLITSWMRTYGCQIRLVDLLIEILLTSLSVDDPWVMVLGTSGFRLGQDGWIGHHAGPLRSPDIRLPLIVSDCGPLRMGSPTNSTAWPTLIRDIGRCGRGEALIAADQWCDANGNASIETESTRSALALTTADWFFVRDTDDSEHLYSKPDDVEDFNDVRRLRGDVIEQIHQSKK